MTLNSHLVKTKNGLISLLLIFFELVCTAQNKVAYHEKIIEAQVNSIFNESIKQKFVLNGRIQLLDKCHDAKSDFYVLLMLSKGKYLKRNGDSSFDKLSIYKFEIKNNVIGKIFEHHEVELPKFVTGVEEIELVDGECEFVDTDNDSVIETIIVYKVIPEINKAISRSKILIFPQTKEEIVQIESSYHSKETRGYYNKNLSISPMFYNLSKMSQTYIVNKLSLMNKQNTLPFKWKKEIRKGKSIIK